MSMRDPDAPGPTIYVSMIVDSGANVSLLAKEHLRSLGITQRGAQAEIERDPMPGLGVKSRFAGWYSKVPLKGQVVLPVPIVEVSVARFLVRRGVLESGDMFNRAAQTDAVAKSLAEEAAKDNC